MAALTPRVEEAAPQGCSAMAGRAVPVPPERSAAPAGTAAGCSATAVPGVPAAPRPPVSVALVAREGKPWCSEPGAPAAQVAWAPTAAATGVRAVGAGCWSATEAPEVRAVLRLQQVTAESVVPAGTPKPIVDKLQKAIAKIAAEPEMIERFKPQGVEIRASTPEEFKQFLAKEEKRWTTLIKEQGIKAE